MAALKIRCLYFSSHPLSPPSSSLLPHLSTMSLRAALRNPGSASVSARSVKTCFRPAAPTRMGQRQSRSSLVTCATATKAPPLPFRVGHGFDLHRLADQSLGYKLIIGGVDIPHTKGCEAHSDGDVLLHTVTDAILGALCMPDIGQLFPDTDPKWKGASSDIFLKEAVRLMEERGYYLGNLDCTIIAQKPKLSPFKEIIRKNLCEMVKADETCQLHLDHGLGQEDTAVDMMSETRNGATAITPHCCCSCNYVLTMALDRKSRL
eukprot:gene15760-21885_t